MYRRAVNKSRSLKFYLLTSWEIFWAYYENFHCTRKLWNISFHKYIYATVVGMRTLNKLNETFDATQNNFAVWQKRLSNHDKKFQFIIENKAKSKQVTIFSSPSFLI